MGFGFGFTIPGLKAACWIADNMGKTCDVLLKLLITDQFFPTWYNKLRNG